MRVAYLFSRFPVLSQTFCVTEMLALEQLGCRVFIGSIHPPETLVRHGSIDRLSGPILYNPEGRLLRELEKKARQEGRWPEKLIDRQTAAYGETVKAPLRARNALWFAREFAHRGVEHVHVHFANRATHTALFLKQLTGIPFSFTAHAQDFMIDFPSRALLGEIVEEAEFVIAVSDWSRTLLASEFPSAAAKIHRIYNGIDLRMFDPGPTPLLGRRSTAQILSVGRLIEFKGFEVLIDACAILAGRGVGFECEIAGDGPLREALEMRIKRAGLDGKVRLLGPLPQEAILGRLRHCDIFALASLTDRQGACDVLPTVITEAMACARPVVSTTTGGIPEQVIDGVTGRLVPPGDAAALASALEQMIASGEAASAMGLEGLARARARFDANASAAELKELFQKSARGQRVTAGAVASRRKGLVLFDEWPMRPFSAAFHEALVGGVGNGLAVGYLRAGRPIEVPAGGIAGRLLGRRQVVDIPLPLDAATLPPRSVIEAAWLARGVRNDEVLRVEGELPEGFEVADLYEAARLLIGLRMGLEGFDSIPLLAVGRMARLIGWLRKALGGAAWDEMPQSACREDAAWVRNWAERSAGE